LRNQDHYQGGIIKLKGLSVFVFLLFIGVILAACGSSDDGGVVPSLVTLGDVSALYNTNGADWNDYVRGGNITNATDTACDAATDTACVHAGEVRVVEATGLSSCTGITASDALGAFNWTCDDSTSPVRVISNGFSSGFGLANLLDFATPGWRENSVTVYKNGTELDFTNSVAWWSNPVVSNTTGGSLGVEGTVYVLPDSVDAVAYELIANCVSLVAAPGIIINGPGAVSNVISATDIDFIWLEGMAINATGDNVGVFWDAVNFSRMQSLSADYAVTGTVKAGISLRSSSNNTLSGVSTRHNSYGSILDSSSGNVLSNISVSNNNYGLVLFLYSSGNTLTHVKAHNNVQIGIQLYGSSLNTLSGVSASNNGLGVHLQLSSDNILSDITVSSSIMEGMFLFSSTGNTLSRVTATNSYPHGIALFTSDGNTFLDMASINNENGVYIFSSDNNVFWNLVASDNDKGIWLQSSSYNSFFGQLKVGSNWSTNCLVSEGSNPGLVNGTCTEMGITGSDMYGIGNASNAILTNSISIVTSFVANISSDDSINTRDTNGIALYDNITEWVNFENLYRSWGNWNSASFPASLHRGTCDTGHLCQIWDWSLYASDTVLVNSLTYPGTGDTADTLAHSWYAAAIQQSICDTLMPGSTFEVDHCKPAQQSHCDAFMPGSIFVIDHCETDFLHNAVEIQGDGIGNDDTLCESDETCLYTPNMGSYQGHGNLISAGSFVDGAISNVTLMKYETNGY